ncbi:MAG TPA: M13 family metallopeptidase N-terminal domain-containing protein, partial [Rhizomicrobium sp.]|nr:M13 family metallopeptidase N-terminal domain-containing protein [Rhizomicrobium sp.]
MSGRHLNLLRAAALATVLLPFAALGDGDKPIYGAWGFDSAGADFNTKPGDNFFRYANGTWLDKTEIPSDKPAYSLRLQMTDRTEGRLHDIFEAADKNGDPNTLEGKVGAFYHAFMDEARIEQLGATPIAPELAAVREAKTRDDLAAMMGRSNVDFEATLYGIYLDIDLKDPSKYAVYLSQSGLGLPDRDYYLNKEFAETKTAYEKYVAQLLQLAGWQNPDAAAKDVVAFETRIAGVSWTKVQQRDPVATYNPMTVAELQKLTPGFAWKGYMANANLSKVTRVIIAEKSAFPKLAAVYASTPLGTLRAWHAFHIADNAAPYLSKAFTDAYFEMHDKTLSGQKEQKARWKRAITVVAGGDFGVGDRFGTFGTMGFGAG